MTRTVEGESVSAEMSPKIVKLAQGIQAINPMTNYEWTVDVESGKTVKITYTYKVYVPARNR